MPLLWQNGWVPPMCRLIPIFLLLLPAMGVAQWTQSPTTDGVVTFEWSNGGRAIPFYPPLPPDSDDLVYDDGNYTGSSRNLQNAGIIQGWPYWAHQVRFTPVSGMVGPLLQVRYVAATQWGSLSMDVAIRDAAGTEVASMTGVAVVIDTNNWQVVDVSSLNFSPGSSDFYVELRPSNPCTGLNGFTVPFSTTGSGRSRFSSDCMNPFSSFASEARDQFIRAVVSTVSLPTLSVSNLIAGQTASVDVTSATAGGWCVRPIPGPHSRPALKPTTRRTWRSSRTNSGPRSR